MSETPETPEVETIDLTAVGNVYAPRADALPAAVDTFASEFIGGGVGEVIDAQLSSASDNGSGGATRWGASVTIVVRVPRPS